MECPCRALLRKSLLQWVKEPRAGVVVGAEVGFELLCFP